MAIEGVEITDGQAEKVEAWLEANAKVPGWLDSFPMGSSYIDTRAAGGGGIGRRRAYVRLDHATAEAVPELRGRQASEVRGFMEARREASALPTP
jgi:hypothetical protein